MENNLENKAKFFAQYWGQQILHYYEVFRSVVCIDYMCDSILEKSYLELTSLSQISDEDINDFNTSFFAVSGFDNYKRAKDFICSISKGSALSSFSHAQKSIDFLRSKGYALPFNGLSVEDQIEFGWVKLKNK